jgi:hypothetical protein
LGDDAYFGIGNIREGFDGHTFKSKDAGDQHRQGCKQYKVFIFKRERNNTFEYLDHWIKLTGETLIV